MFMMSSGGLTAANLFQGKDAILSGPAGGVVGAVETAKIAGFDKVIGFDMGGTSTDVALIYGGVPEVSSELSIDYGLPIHVPMVDVRTVGARGGPLASINAAGVLKVGPESAGSSPGPISYGRGGTEPTITDANMVLGRLDPAGLTAVETTVDVAAIRARIDEVLADPPGFSTEAPATAGRKLVALGRAASTTPSPPASAPP